jgi:hypothetical protein
MLASNEAIHSGGASIGSLGSVGLSIGGTYDNGDRVSTPEKLIDNVPAAYRACVTPPSTTKVAPTT